MSIEDELKELLDNAPIAFGLKNQGHIPTIERMLDEAWERIGKEIGWCPKTAREHYERYALTADITAKAEAAAKEIAEFEYDAHGYRVGTDTIELIINGKFTQEAPCRKFATNDSSQIEQLRRELRAD